MNEKVIDSKVLAEFFIKNGEKENIISSVFDFFKLDCIERCNLDPVNLDNLIRDFISDSESDANKLALVIDVIKQGRESADEKENQLVKEIKEYLTEHFTEEKSIEEIAIGTNFVGIFIKLPTLKVKNSPIITAIASKRLKVQSSLVDSFFK